METRSSRALARSLAEATAGAPPAAARMQAQLAELSGREWLRLDGSARQTYLGQAPLDWVAGWPERLSTADDGGVTAVAASMCRDGRVREAAVAALARTPGPVAAAALAVRAADWVPQVRSAALAAIRARPAAAGLAVRPGPLGTSARDAVVIVPVMLALRERWLGRQAAQEYLAGLAAGAAGTLAELSETGERGGRLWALAALAERDLLADAALETRAMGEQDPVVALWCARRLAAPSGSLPAGTGRRLLGSARASVRAFALEHLAGDQLSREELRNLLTDQSGAVRSVARWRWVQRGEDLGRVYRELLTAPLPRQVAAALQGLDDAGDGCLPAAAVPFLADPSPRVRYAAVRAVGRHSEPGGFPVWLAAALRDDSEKVVAAALGFLRGYPLPPSTLDELDAAGTPRSRRTALAIRQRLSPWERICADLTAITGQDPDLAVTGRADLLSWLQRDAAVTYARPSPGQAARIAALLARSTLTSEQRREVAFVAGIR
jgi:hypothetical protein